MDAKIDELMARLAKSTEEKSDSEKPIEYDAPRTFEEFLKAEHIDEWPQRITSENLMDLESEKLLLGTQEDILKTLTEATPLGMKYLNDLEDRLQELTDRLNIYSDRLIQKEAPLAIEAPENGELSEEEHQRLMEEAREAKLRRISMPSVNKAFLTDMPDRDLLQVHPSRKAKKKMAPEQVFGQDFRETLMENKKHGVENCVFPGFRVGELTELPGSLETPQILNRVTKAQNFNSGFRKFWKKIFQSEASVAIMQDAFWWVFLDKYEKPQNISTSFRRKQDKRSCMDRLFDRIADSFVALFTSINPEVKDKFFAVYSDCLAQSLFVAFLEAFPESERHFQNDFKKYLTNVTWEWVSGVRPPANSWSEWDIEELRSKQAKVTDESLNNGVKTSLDIDEFRKMVNHLGEVGSYPGTAPNTAPSREFSKQGSRDLAKIKSVTRELTKISSNGGAVTTMANTMGPPTTTATGRQIIRKPPQESHQMGPGPELERVLFNIKGQSPLVAHYLNMRQLRERQGHKGRRVRRTQVSKLPEGGATYKQLIKETNVFSESLKEEYQKVCDLTNHEIAKIEKQQRDINRQIEKLKRDLVLSKNFADVKILSEKILDQREQSANMRTKSGSARGVSLSGPDEDSDDAMDD